MSLTDKQQRFVTEYLVDQNATQAAIRAGYAKSGARTEGARLLANADIAALVKQKLEKAAEKAETTVARVLQELSRLGFSDIRQAFDEQGNVLPPDQWSDAFAASVASIEVVTKTLPGRGDDERARVEYIHKIKVWDKNSALEKIAKHLGMFVDRIEHSGPYGGPIQTETRTWRDVLRSEKS